MDEQVLMLLHSSRSDLDLISPYNITPESNIKCHENKGNDQLEELLIDKQILLISTLTL